MLSDKRLAVIKSPVILVVEKKALPYADRSESELSLALSEYLASPLNIAIMPPTSTHVARITVAIHTV